MQNIDQKIAQKIFQVKLIAFDFDGVFTDNMVYVNQDGAETVRCSRSDGIGISKLKSIGVEKIIISTETNPVVTTRANKLNINCIQGCQDKLAVLKQLAEEKGLSLKQIAFVGNDVNDLTCLEMVGLPIVVADSHPDVINCGEYRTSLKGGEGAVREICDLFVRVYDMFQQ